MQDVLREKQRQWLDILRQHPNALRTEIKEKFSSLYKWLNKQDRAWLQKHLPPKKDHSFDWAGLDTTLARAVAESANRIKNANKPRRITVFALGQDTGCYDYLRKQIDRLPETAKVLKEVLEMRVEFTKRRIQETSAAESAVLATGNLISNCQRAQMATSNMDAQTACPYLA
jgi:hypothetical protein